ncbi:phosphotransferase [Arthrobacter sp. zg-Y1143]|uniref:phosphotransferase n=1 Tax=Arthrobacter sp. zg-Y1143 TaxID=3049065 RepID=UPI0024C3B696|nr:phosphotransferase [Arthrobacter sp. zg-Y1143]MDK1329032.1 phosphotransferase [Arthrobacter sp. zg-Y1143]
METWHRNQLSMSQGELVQQWLPGVRLIRDLSWALSDTAVLEVESGERRYVVKAAGLSNHHIGREIAAHESWTRVWSRQHRAPRLARSDLAQTVLVTEYLDGSLAEGTTAEHDPEVHHQAGSLLRQFHDQTSHTNKGYESAATARALSWLERPHRIEKSQVEDARTILAAYSPKPVTVVPTHGDWQPRNWLLHGTELRIIDFGRFAFRPALTDFCRLAAQQWRTHPQLKDVFLAGYGAGLGDGVREDDSDMELWHMTLLREAVSTAVWAYQTGDHAFERQGHRMLADALATFRTDVFHAHTTKGHS